MKTSRKEVTGQRSKVSDEDLSACQSSTHTVKTLGAQFAAKSLLLLVPNWGGCSHIGNPDKLAVSNWFPLKKPLAVPSLGICDSIWFESTPFCESPPTFQPKEEEKKRKKRDTLSMLAKKMKLS